MSTPFSPLQVIFLKRIFLILPDFVFSSRLKVVITMGSAVPHQSGQKRRVSIMQFEYVTFSTFPPSRICIESPRLLFETMQLSTITLRKSPTPSVPILIAAEVEISVQFDIMMFSQGPYSLLPFEVLRHMQSSAHST